MEDRERARQLMMGHLDAELSEGEEREFGLLLADSLELRRELQEMDRLTRSLSGIRIKDPADELLAELEQSLCVKVSMPLGWLLLIAGILVFMSWAGLSWVMDTSHSPVLRCSGLVIFLGFFLVFLSKVKERWIERRNDPYSQVIR